MNSAAEEKEGFRGLIRAGAAGGLRVPCGKGFFDRRGNVGKVIEVRARDFGGHAAALAGEKQCEKIEQRELRGETFRRGNGFFEASAGEERGAGFVGDGGSCD